MGIYNLSIKRGLTTKWRKARRVGKKQVDIRWAYRLRETKDYSLALPQIMLEAILVTTTQNSKMCD
jgi:hypothetical protein